MIFYYRTRIVLIGHTGVGKSSIGNTLLGDKYFVESASSQSVTTESKIGEKTVGTRRIKVVDTPGVFNTKGDCMIAEIEKFFDFLAPGPHAIVLVVAPNRESESALRAMDRLHVFFGDDHFLDFTLVVMVRKNDIIGEFGESETIEDFIEKKGSESLKRLYTRCNQRIVTVENKQKMSERQQEAEKILDEIDKMDGYFDHFYFQKVHDAVDKLVETRQKCSRYCTEKDSEITIIKNEKNEIIRRLEEELRLLGKTDF